MSIKALHTKLKCRIKITENLDQFRTVSSNSITNFNRA